MEFIMTKTESTTKPADKRQLDRHEEIALRAYFLWQERGSPIGSPTADWLRAEQEVCGNGTALTETAQGATAQVHAAAA